MHGTTANEPLKMIQQVEGQRGCEAWHLIVRRYDQRNTSDRSSAYAALISNITERVRAKDVEQFDDILRTFTNEMTKFENRFGKIRDEEKVLAVKKLMPESLLNYSRTVSSSLRWRTSSLTRYRQSPQPEAGNMTPAPQWRLEWQRKKMERMQAKKETSES